MNQTSVAGSGATVLLALLVALMTTAASTVAAAGGPSETSFAVVGVDVLPMDRDRVLENQTVVVVDGRITAVGDASKTAIPDHLARIDGESRYLMPGLADMHVHLRETGEYVNFLRHGVTTVMHLGASAEKGRTLLEHRRQIEVGEMLGPRIYTTERILDGDPPTGGGSLSLASADAAREAVAGLGSRGFDFVKTYNNVSLPVFRAIVDEADEHGLPVFGHIPREFDAITAFQEGLDVVVHTEEFFFTYFKGPRSTKEMDRSYRADRSAIPALVKALLENEVAIMPDLSFTFTNFIMWDGLENIWADAELEFQHPDTVNRWRVSNINRREEIENFIVRGQWKFDLMQTLTLEFERAGILQVVGTDASLPGLFPGRAAHRELTELVKAGLSNFEALSIATRNAGELVRRYIDEDTRFGRVEKGYRADLVLLGSNPLEDVRNARDILAVAAGGRWMEVEELDAARAALAARYRVIDRISEEVDAALAGDRAQATLLEIVANCGGDAELVESIEGRVNSAGYGAAFAGDLERAREILTLATAVFPDSANAWDSLAEVSLYMGERDRAIGYYEKALEVDPEFSNAAEQLKQIASEAEESP